MPAVTALRARRDGRVSVELDGAVWRTLPAEAVVRAGLAVGLELDRAAARTLRRELRRVEARTSALRALRMRDRPAADIDARLQRAGFAEAERGETLATLGRVGLVDDARFARSRADALAARGYGDAAIRFDLERRGLGAEPVHAALAALEHEVVRAQRLVARHGRGPATARRLASRGFGDDAVEVAAGAIDDDPVG